jgi:protein disulfide-isomerase-like protein
MKIAAFLVTALTAVSALELTPETYDSATAGKTVFLKFFAPWCGHCKKMKPAWDSLMTEYADNSKILVADVDCTAEGKPLCDGNGVKGFPTLKFGDPSSLEDYEGGRDEASLTKFASELKPSCSPANIDLCDADGKAAIEKLQALSADELAAQIKEGDDKIQAAEDTFKSEVDKLQAAYKQLQDDKDATIADVKASGLGLAKAVAASAGKKAAKDEL